MDQLARSARNGRDRADRRVARPGPSRQLTGLLPSWLWDFCPIVTAATRSHLPGTTHLRCARHGRGRICIREIMPCGTFWTGPSPSASASSSTSSRCTSPPGSSSRCAATRRKASGGSSRPWGISSTRWSWARSLPSTRRPSSGDRNSPAPSARRRSSPRTRQGGSSARSKPIRSSAGATGRFSQCARSEELRAQCFHGGGHECPVEEFIALFAGCFGNQ